MARLIVLFVLTSLILFSPVWPAEKKAVLSVSPAKVQIGDPINVTLEVKTSKSERFSVSEGFNLSDLELLNEKTPVFFEKEGEFISAYQFEAVAWSVGEKKLGPVVIIFDSGEKLMSNEASVVIESVISEENSSFADIKNNLDSIPAAYIWLIVLFLIIVLIVLIIFIVKLIKKKNTKDENVEKIRTPEEIAEESLQKLAEYDLTEEKSLKEYYVQLAEILRRYIEARYSLPALDSTTGELYKILRDNEYLKERASDIKTLLSQCDLVKFAKYLPYTHKDDFDMTETIYNKIKYREKKEDSKS